eukprot:scaffold1675_cov93-Isochrysis_galbana.AAC.1
MTPPLPSSPTLRLQPPRRDTDSHQQRPHLGHGAASHLFVDATHVPLRRLVLPLHYHNAGGGQAICCVWTEPGVLFTPQARN